MKHFRQAVATFKLCHWCGTPRARQREHVIPKWSYPIVFAGQVHVNNIRPACGDCNQEKGPMPPALFLRLRRDDPDALFEARREWSTISATYTSGAYMAAPDEGATFVAMVRAAMLEPFTAPDMARTGATLGDVVSKEVADAFNRIAVKNAAVLRRYERRMAKREIHTVIDGRPWWERAKYEQG